MVGEGADPLDLDAFARQPFFQFAMLLGKIAEAEIAPGEAERIRLAARSERNAAAEAERPQAGDGGCQESAAARRQD